MLSLLVLPRYTYIGKVQFQFLTSTKYVGDLILLNRFLVGRGPHVAKKQARDDIVHHFVNKKRHKKQKQDFVFLVLPILDSFSCFLFFLIFPHCPELTLLLINN